MANILNLIDFIRAETGYGPIESLPGSLKSYQRSLDEDRTKTIANAARRMTRHKSIFTLSNSSTVRDSIIAAKNGGWPGHVLLVESRPRNEGAMLASVLSRADIPVTLAVDTLIPDLVERSAAIFLGADAVTPDYFVNKIGSVIAVDYAERLGKPVYVAADRSKIISNARYEFTPDSNPVDEIMRGSRKRLRIENSYFEKVTPAGRFKYICGNLICTPPQIKNILKRPS